jgi:Mor family transcriptional regulator
MDNTTRFNAYISALQQFRNREGHTRVPALHIEIMNGTEIKLGSFCSYCRQRYKANALPANRIDTLNSIPGWEWGPFKPGPSSNNERNNTIRLEYSNGLSLADLAAKYQLSRQRVHQIVAPRRSHASV